MLPPNFSNTLLIASGRRLLNLLNISRIRFQLEISGYALILISFHIDNSLRLLHIISLLSLISACPTMPINIHSIKYTYVYIYIWIHTRKKVEYPLLRELQFSNLPTELYALSRDSGTETGIGDKVVQEWQCRSWRIKTCCLYHSLPGVSWIRGLKPTADSSLHC